MSKVPSKMYRRLAPLLTTPIFYVQIGDVFYRDDDIVSIKIIHGSESAEPDVYPTRCEVHLRGELPIVNGDNLYVSITPPELTVTGEYGQHWRFAGRVSTQTVHRDPRNPTTVVQAASWMALALSSNVDWTVGGDWGHRDAVGDLVAKLQRMFPDEIAWVEPRFQNDDRVYETEVTTISSGMRKYITDLGIYCFIIRAGWLKFRRPIELLADYQECVAGPGGPFPVPLEYHQASAPMDLEQSVENKYVGTKIKRRNYDSTIAEGVWSFGKNWEETGITPSEYVSFDWSHMRYLNDNLYRSAINAAGNRIFFATLTSRSVKLDMLRLLTSGNPRDVDAAKAALRVEPGDFIPFGRDWPDEYRGAKLVTGFTETVTPDEWTLEFAVHGPQQTVGRYAHWWSSQPDPEPQITSYPYDRFDRGANSLPGLTCLSPTVTNTTCDQWDDIGYW